MRHSNETVSASPVNDHVGVWSLVRAGGRAVTVGADGATRSSVYGPLVCAPTFPAGSVARTRHVYVPSGCAERSYEYGLEHGVQSLMIVAPRSIRQEAVAPGS